MTPSEIRAYLDETALLALAHLGPSVVVPSPPIAEASAWRWVEAPFMLHDDDLGHVVRIEAIKAVILRARMDRLVRFAEARGRWNPAMQPVGLAGPFGVTCALIAGKRAVSIDIMGKPTTTGECDACGAEATTAVTDLVDVTLPGDDWSSTNKVGIERYGCAAHVVVPITLKPDDVPRWTPWWNEGKAAAFFLKRHQRANDTRMRRRMS